MPRTVPWLEGSGFPARGGSGAGIALDRTEVIEESVHRAGQALLDDPRLRVAAATLRDQIASTPSPADRLRDLEHLVAAR